jgi:hypothetical protein
MLLASLVALTSNNIRTAPPLSQLSGSAEEMVVAAL